MPLFIELLLGSTALALVAILVPIVIWWKKLAPLVQTPTEVGAWSKLIDQTGLAVGLLLIGSLVLWRLIKWMRPRADRVLDEFIANANRVQPMLEAQLARDEVQRARDAAMLLAMSNIDNTVKAHTLVVSQLAERVSAQSNRGQLLAEGTARLVDNQQQIMVHITTLIESVNARDIQNAKLAEQIGFLATTLAAKHNP